MARRALSDIRDDLFNYPIHWGTRVSTLEQYKHTLFSAFKTHSSELDNRLPCPALLEPLYRLGHAVLGPVKENWSSASEEAVRTGRNYFLTALMLGLRLFVVEDPASSFCMVKYGEHSMCHPTGILALVALAEIAYSSGRKGEGRERAAYLLRCAKLEYKLQYGEGETFYLKYYPVMALVGTLDDLSIPPGWEERRFTPEQELRATNRL
jgi:hypothetical protein